MDIIHIYSLRRTSAIKQINIRLIDLIVKRVLLREILEMDGCVGGWLADTGRVFTGLGVSQSVSLSCGKKRGFFFFEWLVGCLFVYFLIFYYCYCY